MTTIERGDDVLLPLHVVSSTPLTPHMVRLRLAGHGLEPYESTRELHVRLFVPKLGRHEVVQQALRGLTGQPSASLVNDMCARYYTVRRVDARSGWMDIDFVVHEPAGPGSAFALNALPGDLCAISAPCGRGARPAQRYLLAGDESALPAIARIGESLPAQARGTVLVEVASAAERIDFDVPSGVSLHWLYRNGEPAASSRRLEARVREELAGWPAPVPSLFVWMAGEWTVAASLRPLLSVYKPNSLCTTYWRAESRKETVT